VSRNARWRSDTAPPDPRQPSCAVLTTPTPSHLHGQEILRSTLCVNLYPQASRGRYGVREVGSRSRLIDGRRSFDSARRSEDFAHVARVAGPSNTERAPPSYWKTATFRLAPRGAIAPLRRSRRLPLRDRDRTRFGDVKRFPRLSSPPFDKGLDLRY